MFDEVGFVKKKHTTGSTKLENEMA